MTRYLMLIVGTMMLVGCGTSTRSYSIVVENGGLEPVTVWLTKDGPPAEASWLSPEQIAVAGLDKKVPLNFTPIPAGKTAELKPVEGRFQPRTNAVLRVYRGQRQFNDLLSIGSDSPNRTDVKLQPGANEIIIDKNGVASRK